MKTRGRGKPWVTVSELAGEANVSVEVIRTAIRSGLLDAWACLDGGVLRFRPDTAAFLRWGNQLVEKVSTGEIEPITASERLWCRARHLRRRVARVALAR